MVCGDLPGEASTLPDVYVPLLLGVSNASPSDIRYEEAANVLDGTVGDDDREDGDKYDKPPATDAFRKQCGG